MTDSELREAQQRISDLERRLAESEEDFKSTMAELGSGAELRAQRLADELLTCAIEMVGLTDSSRDELDVALDMIRSRAEQHGLMRRRPPRSVE